jgi:cytochrome P450
VSTEFLFGECARSLLLGSARLDVDQFDVSFNRALAGMTTRTSLGRALSLFDHDPEWREAYTNIHALVDGYIDRAIEQRHHLEKPTKDLEHESSRKEPAKRPFSMLHELVEDTQDRKFLRDQLLNVFLPARDSSSIGLSDLFFHLARNPRVWTKLRSEALEIDQPLTFDVLKSMRYLQCVLRERKFNLNCFQRHALTFQVSVY